MTTPWKAGPHQQLPVRIKKNNSTLTSPALVKGTKNTNHVFLPPTTFQKKKKRNMETDMESRTKMEKE